MKQMHLRSQNYALAKKFAQFLKLFFNIISGFSIHFSTKETSTACCWKYNNIEIFQRSKLYKNICLTFIICVYVLPKFCLLLYAVRLYFFPPEKTFVLRKRRFTCDFILLKPLSYSMLYVFMSFVGMFLC